MIQYMILCNTSKETKSLSESQMILHLYFLSPGVPTISNLLTSCFSHVHTVHLLLATLNFPLTSL